MQKLSLGDDDPVFEGRSWRKSFEATKVAEVRANAPDRRNVNAWMRPDVQNLACHSGNEVQRESNTFTFLSFALLAHPLPVLAPARSSFTPRERDHKRTSGPPGAPRWEFNGGILQSSRRRLWCVYKNLSGVHLCFDSFEASDYHGSKGRQRRSSAPGVGDFTAEFRGDWQRGGQSTSVLLKKKERRRSKARKARTLTKRLFVNLLTC